MLPWFPSIVANEAVRTHEWKPSCFLFPDIQFHRGCVSPCISSDQEREGDEGRGAGCYHQFPRSLSPPPPAVPGNKQWCLKTRKAYLSKIADIQVEGDCGKKFKSSIKKWKKGKSQIKCTYISKLFIWEQFTLNVLNKFVIVVIVAILDFSKCLGLCPHSVKHAKGSQCQL